MTAIDDRQTTEAEDGELQLGVDVVDVCKYFGRTRVLNHLSLAVRRGEFLSILGPSGCGKTTLLRIIGGFTMPTSGVIRIAGEFAGNKAPYERDTSMVFQQLALFPHMTVFDNIAYGLKVRRLPKAETISRVDKVLELVKLTGFENRYPKQLSGGQQQRVALARSLILQPGVVLLDEPLGSLDLKLREEMQIEVKKLHEVLGTTFIYVTHDQSEALTMSDRVAVMQDGRIEQIGTAEDIYERPQTRFVADFIGDTNIFEGIVLPSDDNRSLLQAQGLTIAATPSRLLRSGQPGILSVRPQQVRLSGTPPGDGNVFPGVVEEKLYRGAAYRYIVRFPDGQAVTSELSGADAGEFRTGDEVFVSWLQQDGYALAE